MTVKPASTSTPEDVSASVVKNQLRCLQSFADAIAVSFRTSPRLRAFEVAPACTGSPSLQPQVLAEDKREPGEVATFSVHLKPGMWRIRCIPKRQVASILVEEGGKASPENVIIGPQEISPHRSVLRAGPCQLPIRNDSAHRVPLCLEQRHLAHDSSA